MQANKGFMKKLPKRQGGTVFSCRYSAIFRPHGPLYLRRLHSYVPNPLVANLQCIIRVAYCRRSFNLMKSPRKWESQYGWAVRLRHLLRGTQGDLDEVKVADLEVWPESHWPGFALHQTDVLSSYIT